MSRYKELLLETQDYLGEVIEPDSLDFTNDVEFWVNPVEYFIGYRNWLLEELWSHIEDGLEAIHEEEDNEHNMDSEYCSLTDFGCEDCYISECSSSACMR